LELFSWRHALAEILDVPRPQLIELANAAKLPFAMTSNGLLVHRVDMRAWKAARERHACLFQCAPFEI
jgi:hypothetical protein